MITERDPEDWRDLQREVGRILAECGMESEVEKKLTLARGTAEVDVYAVESIRGRVNTIYCECKAWKSSIPQTVIHAFRTVVGDGGPNVGYVITTSDFQSGAFTAADLTNLRLVTWREFQAEFEKTWIENYLRPEVTKRLDALMSLTEPLLPLPFHELSETKKNEYLELRDRHCELGFIAMEFSSYFVLLGRPLPTLPLRGRKVTSKAEVPAELLDATAYGDFLDILIASGERAIAELRAALRPERM